MWRSPLGRGWVGMLMIGFVWAARSRLPFPTLIYWPEAAHLGDLLRLWVRPEARVYTRPPDFQEQASATPDAAPDAALYGAAVLISDPVGFRQTCPLQIKEKTTLPGAPASVSGLHSFAALAAYRRRAPPSGSGRAHNTKSLRGLCNGFTSGIKPSEFCTILVCRGWFSLLSSVMLWFKLKLEASTTHWMSKQFNFSFLQKSSPPV